MFTTPLGEGDFFWHVKTGEWIWQHKALPAADPFSFTVKDINPLNPESKRIPFLLKQYWLGQLAFFGIWKAAGETGMILFRAACYTGILLFLYRWARKFQQGAIPLITVVLVGNVLRNYSNERPQIFAFLLLPLLVYNIERIRTSGIPRPPGLPVLALPLIMLAWSNCHGSFIVGIVIIALYGCSHLLDCSRRRKPLHKSTLLVFVASILITLLNPNGLGAFREFFSLSRSYTDLVSEYISPIQLAYQHHLFDYGYWSLLAGAALTIAVRWRRMDPAHLLLLAALAGLSLTGTRYIPFFVLISPILCSYVPPPRPGILPRFAPFLVVIALCVATDYRNILKFRAEKSFPVSASRFLGEIKPHGNMFNYINWGGYLLCYSDYPVFIDGRTLVEDLLPVHNSVLAGHDWQSTMDRYAINFIIIPGTDAISMQAYPILLQLLGNNDWGLVYQDDVALIFLRNNPENRLLLERYGMNKAIISSHIQARWKWQASNDF